MNIGIFVPNCNQGGTERVATRLVDLFSEMGHNCIIITLCQNRFPYHVKARVEALDILAKKSKLFRMYGRYSRLKQLLRENKIDVVLIDTAGRMQNKDSLMQEIEKVTRVNKPDMKIFLGESITGNDATEQATKFNEAIDLTGIILSKADVDENGGAAISVSKATGKPILFLGTGQGYDDLEVFDKDKLIEKLGL